MAHFEGEVAQIIPERFLNKNEISITFDKDERLKLNHNKKIITIHVKKCMRMK